VKSTDYEAPLYAVILLLLHDFNMLCLMILRRVRAEPLVPGSDPFEVKIAIEMLKGCGLSGVDRILGEMVQAGGDISRSDIHKLINSA
jgi:hypothetical protein